MSTEQNRLESKLDRLDDKLDDIVVQQTKHTVILGQNNDNWKEHMKRTDANEEMIGALRDEHITFRATISTMHRVGAAVVVLAGLVLSALKLLVG